MSWSTDECVSFYNCDFFTLQWCVISESLRLSTHDKGPHGYGGIWGGTNASFHHNLMAHHDSRTPRFGAGNGKTIPPHTETVDHRNNVIYNHGNTYGGEGMNINIVNNFYKPGAKSSTGTARGRIISLDKDTKYPEHLRYQIWGQLYVDGNIVDDGKNEVNCSNATRDNWTYGVFNQFASGYGKVSEAAKDSIRQSAAFDIMGELPNGTIIPTSVSTHSANQAFEKVLEYAGASLSRDSHDERIVHETRTGTTTFQGLSKYNGWTTGHPDAPDVDWRSKAYPKPGIIDSHWNTKPLDAGDSWSPWPILKSGEAVSDTDRDGIPDGWLEAKGYSGKSATDLNEEGYTYLEVRWIKNMLTPVNLSTTVYPEGAGRVTPASSVYESGALVTVTASRNFGYLFKEWQVNGKQVSTDLVYSFTIQDDIEVVAVFDPIATYSLEILKSGDGANWGKLSLSPEPVDGRYEEGS